MNEVIAWLESPDGEQWSYATHRPSVNALMMIKEQSELKVEKRIILWSVFLPWGYGWKLGNRVTPHYCNAPF